MKRLFFLLLAALAASTPGLAKDNPRVSPDTKAEFTEVATSVRGEMRDGGRYQYLKPKERVQVDQGLNEMGALFDKYPTVDAMNEQAKIALFNAQEKVNSALALGSRDRMICKKQAPLGSHIPVEQCHIYG